LGRSRQENEGAKALAEVFNLMGTLEEVVMPQNGIHHEGIEALANAFENNPNLKNVIIYNNKLQYDYIPKIDQIIKSVYNSTYNYNNPIKGPFIIDYDFIKLYVDIFYIKLDIISIIKELELDKLLNITIV
jgi:hypothetical protein